MSNQITVLPVCLPGSATARYGWTIQVFYYSKRVEIQI